MIEHFLNTHMPFDAIPVFSKANARWLNQIFFQGQLIEMKRKKNVFFSSWGHGTTGRLSMRAKVDNNITSSPYPTSENINFSLDGKMQL